MIFVSSFHPRGGVFCCSWRDGAFFFFSEAGRGVFFFFPRRDGAVVSFFGTGWLFFFFSTGRDGAVFFFFFEGRDGTVVFWRWQFFRRDGAKSLHRPAKGGLNRPASRLCKALKKSYLMGLKSAHFQESDFQESGEVDRFLKMGTHFQERSSSLGNGLCVTRSGFCLCPAYLWLLILVAGANL